MLLENKPDRQPGDPLLLEALWAEALAELRLQMLPVAYNRLLLGSQVLSAASTPTFWVIVARNEYACEWLTHRLYPMMARTATAVAGRPMMLCFIPGYWARRNGQLLIVNRQS